MNIGSPKTIKEINKSLVLNLLNDWIPSLANPPKFLSVADWRGHSILYILLLLPLH